MFMQHAAGLAAISGIDEQTRPEPLGIAAKAPDSPPASADKPPAAAAADQAPPGHKRGRPRRPPAPPGKTFKKSTGVQAEAALVNETVEVISNLQKQGLLKPPAESLPGGGPGHRTKNCRPVQINLSETMFRQLKMIAATQSISIKDQIIAALLRQGYKG